MVDISILTMVYIPTNITGGAPPCVGYLSVFSPAVSDMARQVHFTSSEAQGKRSWLSDGNQRCRFPNWLVD